MGLDYGPLPIKCYKATNLFLRNRIRTWPSVSVPSSDGSLASAARHIIWTQHTGMRF
jgi:hypothetical protein